MYICYLPIITIAGQHNARAGVSVRSGPCAMDGEQHEEDHEGNESP